MEVKKSEPINLTTETNQSETTSPQTPDNRQLGWIFPFPALCFIPPNLCAYLCAYLCRLFACLCSRIPTQWPLRTYTSPTLPPLFRSVKILVAFLQFFFEFFLGNFFFWNFSAEFHKVLFCGCGYFWESTFFGLSILVEKDSFFCKSGI